MYLVKISRLNTRVTSTALISKRVASNHECTDRRRSYSTQYTRRHSTVMAQIGASLHGKLTDMNEPHRLLRTVPRVSLPWSRRVARTSRRHGRWLRLRPKRRSATCCPPAITQRGLTWLVCRASPHAAKVGWVGSSPYGTKRETRPSSVNVSECMAAVELSPG